MKLCANLGLLLLAGAIPLAAWSDNPPGNQQGSPQNQGAVDQISQYLSGQSIQLGGSYSQSYIFLNSSNSTSRLTDNGRASPIIDYTSSEHILYKFPMKNGDGVWGLNFTGTFKQQHFTYQVVPGENQFRGDNLNTHVD